MFSKIVILLVLALPNTSLLNASAGTPEMNGKELLAASAAIDPWGVARS
jgi:hypothetical protein